MHDNPATNARSTRRIGQYDGYFFDLDGTVYLSGRKLPGVDRLFAWLSEHGLPYAFLTNNPTSTAEDYERRLEGLGIPAKGRVVTSAMATAAWLADNHPGAVVYAIGEAPLERTLQEAGIMLSSDPRSIDIVVSSFDRSFTFAKLETAFRAIVRKRGAMLVATNPDRYCPVEGGPGEPDAAAITAAIEACTGTTCSHVFGKPSPAMARIATGLLGVEARRSIMVGDRLYTDIAMAIGAGMDSALVLTGDASAEDVACVSLSERPTYCLERIDELVPLDAGAD